MSRIRNCMCLFAVVLVVSFVAITYKLVVSVQPQQELAIRLTDGQGTFRTDWAGNVVGIEIVNVSQSRLATIERLHFLRQLSIQDTSVDDLTFLGNLEFLRHLSFSNCPGTLVQTNGSEVSNIGEIEFDLVSLQKLNWFQNSESISKLIIVNPFPEGGFDAMDLPSLPSLESLAIVGCTIENPDLLGKNSNLRFVNLYACDIDGDISFVSRLDRLSELSLVGTQIINIHELGNASRLKIIDHDSLLSEADVKKIQALLPQCQLLPGYDD